MRYITFSKVVSVEERFFQSWAGGVGGDAKFTPISRGYFLFVEGSYEALGIGFDKPDLQPGDRIKITIEKEP